MDDILAKLIALAILIAFVKTTLWVADGREEMKQEREKS